MCQAPCRPGLAFQDSKTEEDKIMFRKQGPTNALGSSRKYAMRLPTSVLIY
jgi:hypothetical protein